MHVRSYKSFSDELVKIAGVSLDAGTRANLAGRYHKEYLPGGQLPSNDPGETNFVPKIAAGLVSKEKDDKRLRRAKKKFQRDYSKIRDPAGSAIRGGFYGAFLSSVARGGREIVKPWRALRIPVGIGAGLGLADYVARGKKKKKTAMVGSTTFTPGRSLAQTRAVGSFQDKLIHKGDKLRPATMGQRFTIPTIQNQ